MNFLADLRTSAVKSAEFLREKMAQVNDDESYVEDEYYSSLAVFVADFYSRLVTLDEKYWNQITLEFYKPKKGEKTTPKIRPDIVYSGQNGDRYVVEVAPVWWISQKTGEIRDNDKSDISDDYDKLLRDYKNIESKVWLVPFLGRPSDYSRNKFHEEVLKLVHGNANLEVVTC